MDCMTSPQQMRTEGQMVVGEKERLSVLGQQDEEEVERTWRLRASWKKTNMPLQLEKSRELALGKGWTL